MFARLIGLLYSVNSQFDKKKEIKMNVQELRDLINKHDQTKIAERSGVTRSYINALANGKRVNPTIKTIDRIVEAIKELE